MNQSTQHLHDFGQGQSSSAGKRLFIVTLITLCTMFVEIIMGYVTGSMALLADGVHMGSHSLALGLATLAYVFTHRYAQDRRLSLGSGKINDLIAYSTSLLLLITTLWLMAESVQRLLSPTVLIAKDALIVAVLGLIINLICAFLLNDSHAHHHHDHNHEHDHTDNNLRAALIHVIADAVTSVAAIIGIFAAWQWGWRWLDPIIAIVGSLVILKWSIGLLMQTGKILLDYEENGHLREKVVAQLSSIADTKILDLHLWQVGQGAWTLMAVVEHAGQVSPDEYKKTLAGLPQVHHPIIEIQGR